MEYRKHPSKNVHMEVEAGLKYRWGCKASPNQVMAQRTQPQLLVHGPGATAHGMNIKKTTKIGSQTNVYDLYVER